MATGRLLYGKGAMFDNDVDVYIDIDIDNVYVYVVIMWLIVVSPVGHSLSNLCS